MRVHLPNTRFTNICVTQEHFLQVVVVIRKKKTVFNCYKLQKGVAMRMIRILGFCYDIHFLYNALETTKYSPIPFPAQLYTFPGLGSILYSFSVELLALHISYGFSESRFTYQDQPKSSLP